MQAFMPCFQVPPHFFLVRFSVSLPSSPALFHGLCACQRAHCLSFSYRHCSLHPSSKIPHPSIDFVQQAAVASIRSRVSSAMDEARLFLIPHAEGNSWTDASSNETRHKWRPAENIADEPYVQDWMQSRPRSWLMQLNDVTMPLHWIVRGHWQVRVLQKKGRKEH